MGYFWPLSISVSYSWTPENTQVNGLFLPLCSVLNAQPTTELHTVKVSATMCKWWLQASVLRHSPEYTQLRKWIISIWVVHIDILQLNSGEHSSKWIIPATVLPDESVNFNKERYWRSASTRVLDKSHVTFARFIASTFCQLGHHPFIIQTT